MLLAPFWVQVLGACCPLLVASCCLLSHCTQGPLQHEPGSHGARPHAGAVLAPLLCQAVTRSRCRPRRQASYASASEVS